MDKYIKYILISLLFCFPFYATAQNHNEQLWQEASELYAGKQYDEAVAKYKELLEYGESSALYFNYANALYKSNQIGLSILNYERALRLDPSNENIQFNLDFVNQMKTDKIEPIEQFFLSEWIESLGRLLTSNQWAYFSIILFAVTLILVLVYLFAKQMWLRKASFFTFIFLFVFSMCAMSYSFSVKNSIENNPEAIVLSGSVSVKSSPDESGTEVFVIHEGTKVIITSALSDWSEVKLSDGNRGWLPTSAIEVI